MAVSFVNGFYCASSCDVAKAKKGEDPHPADHAAATDAAGKDKAATGASRADGPSVVFGGALAATADASRVAPPSASQDSSAVASDSRSQSVDLLV
jgi:hypothetical protein